MPLSETPDTVTWPETYYVYVEKTGPFLNSAPAAWQQLHQLTGAIAEHNRIDKYFSLYDMKGQIYRAGVSVTSEPKALPDGVASVRYPGGRYTRFILTGPFAQLPEASRRVFEIVRERKIPVGEGFNIEHYVNDPRTTPEDQLTTEILLPAA